MTESGTRAHRCPRARRLALCIPIASAVALALPPACSTVTDYRPPRSGSGPVARLTLSLQALQERSATPLLRVHVFDFGSQCPTGGVEPRGKAYRGGLWLGRGQKATIEIPTARHLFLSASMKDIAVYCDFGFGFVPRADAAYRAHFSIGSRYCEVSLRDAAGRPVPIFRPTSCAPLARGPLPRRLSGAPDGLSNPSKG